MTREHAADDATRQFRRLLERMFRLDCADLDFGVYRVLAQRRAQLEALLDEGLLPQVQRALASTDADAREVFSALTRFFARYYQDGDFVAQPRAQEGVYAIPYDGREVALHWASAAQHYVKTSERHADYAARVEGVADVASPRLRLRLAAAEADRDNSKTSEKRRYLLRARQPVELAGDSLTAWFEFRAPAAGGGRAPTQRSLCAVAEAAILAAAPEPWRLALARPAPQRPDAYTVLGYHLRRYTRRNTADFFIHKDLGGFLRSELEGFLARELLAPATRDCGDAAALAAVARIVQATRGLGEKIIAWLAQLEEFQRRLFRKQKFVLRSDWILPLRELSAEARARVLAQPALRRQLESVAGGPPDESGARGETVFTGPLSATEARALVLGRDGLDEARTGLILRGENLAALRLLTPGWRGAVPLVYIDPPYNTGGDGFLYRDAYQRASWLSMMADRLEAGRALQRPDGVIAVSIDDAELHRAKELLERVYGRELATLVWDRNRKNDARYFSVGHEYMLVYARDGEALAASGVRFREPKPGVEEARALFRQLAREHGGDWEAIRRGWLAWLDAMAPADPRRRMRRYAKVGPRGPYRDDGNINWPGGGGPRYEVLHPETGRPCKTPRSGWRYATPERLWDQVAAGVVVFGPDHTTVPRVVSRLFELDGQVMPSVHYSYAQTAAREHDAMFGRRVFDNPKPWRDLARLIRYLGDASATVLDYFAGSGSTGHAVLALNREDGGARRMLLVEMGAHGDSVLIPRLQKAAMGDTWSGGQLQTPDPARLLCQVLYLESYDDTLENVELAAPEGVAPQLAGDAALREDYTLRYMLDIESRGSLLRLERFRDPWRYTIKVRRGGVAVDAPVDLVETFNLLLGLRVRRYDDLGRGGLLAVVGAAPDDARVVVLWRDCDKWPNGQIEPVLRELLDAEAPVDRVYLNGDSHALGARRASERWTLEPIEERFHARMFDDEDPA